MTRVKEYFSDKIEGVHFVRCPICRVKLRLMDPRHLKQHGFETKEDFAESYPHAKLICDELYDIRFRQAQAIPLEKKAQGGYTPHNRELSERGLKRKQEAAKRQALEAFETLENGLKKEGLITVDEAIIISGRSRRALQRAAQKKRITATVEHCGTYKLIGLSPLELLKSKRK